MHSQLRSAQAIRLRDTEGSALRANRSHVAQTKGVMLCVHSILLPSTVQPLASTEFSLRSISSSAWTDRCRAIRPTISRGLAGFTDADLSLEAKENMLTIHGEKQTN